MKDAVTVETAPDGKSIRATLAVEDYIDLLIRASVVDPAYWPADKAEGAVWLKRLREIEEECVRRHGAFDWEQLPPELQDEYDSLWIRLETLRGDGETTSLQNLVEELR